MHFRAHPDYQWDFGLAVGTDGDFNSWVYHNVTKEVIVYTDANENGDAWPMDTHGTSFLDLDGDGVLDMITVAGGGEGGEGWVRTMPDGHAFPSSKDNLVFWGQPERAGYDKLIGGKDVARESGLECRHCRGR